MITTVTALALTVATAPPAVTVTRIKTHLGLRATSAAGSYTGRKYIVGLETGQCRIMDAAGLVPTVNLTGHVQPCYGVALSPDGKYAVTGDEQAKIFLWDASTGKKIREFPREKGHTRGIQSITFSPTGKQIVTVGKDDAICVWNVSGGNPVAKVVGEPANFYGGFMSKSGSVYAGTQKEGLRVLAPKTLKAVAKVSLPGGQGANSFAMNRAATLGATGGRDGTVTVITLGKLARVFALKGHTDYVTSCEFAPNGRFLVTASADGTAIAWDAKSGQRLTKIPNRSYVGSPIAFTGDGKYLVLTNSSDEVEVFSMTPSQYK